MPTTISKDVVESLPEARRLSLLFTALFYGVLGLLGIFWLIVVQELNPARYFHLRSLPLHGTMGLLLGGVVVLFSRISVSRFSWARSMEDEFRTLLRDQPFWTIPLLALFSAVGEELFFRGALQEVVGVWWQAAIFGLVHFPFSRKMWAWPLFALGMGVIFGWVTIGTGTLWCAVVAHGAINSLNMWMILRGTSYRKEQTPE